MNQADADMPPAWVWGHYTALQDACKGLMFNPAEPALRRIISRLLQADHAGEFRAGTLARGLAEEARAHGDDLALRLDHAGSDDLTIRAAAARLHQTLVCLGAVLCGHGRSVGWPVPPEHSGAVSVDRLPGSLEGAPPETYRLG